MRDILKGVEPESLAQHRSLTHASFDNYEVLNLNQPFLKSNRKAVIDGFQAMLRRRGELREPTLRRMLRKWNGDDGPGFLQPFCQVVVYWLRKRVKRA